MELLYGIVEWLNGHPILDGMKCFTTKDQAVEYADIQEKLSAKTKYDVNYTIIRLEKDTN